MDLLEGVGVFVFVQELLHAFQLAGLALGEILFVSRTTIERKRVVRVLWVLLMEDVILAVVPVGEGGMVGACLLDGLRGLHNFTLLGLGALSFLASEPGLVRRDKVHGVRVDDLGFFLKVEGLLMALNLCLCKLAVVILTVVREQRFWVGVSDETISAASCTGTLITGWQTRNCHKTKVS